MNGSSGIPNDPTMVVSGGAAAGTLVACRWNPTKEQINILESLYVQGLKRPTAEQIQEITGRLQAYGHVEAKNVFYWFQNHKTRQRQKEKQDRQSLFRQYNHHHRRRKISFINLSPSLNGFYAHPQIATPSTTTCPIRRRSPRSTRPRLTGVDGFMLMHQLENDVAVGARSNIEQDEAFAGENNSPQETLELFPLHPTGILQERVGTSNTGSGSCLESRACTFSFSGYFDFLY